MRAAHEQFDRDARDFIDRRALRRFIGSALASYARTRSATASRFADPAGARALASAIKWEALGNLDRLLDQFASRLEARGATVHWAATAAEARACVLGLVRARHATRVVKSKCMTTEEIGLNHALEEAGCEVIESDLGEYIVQVRREAPFHFVFPAMHLTRGEVSATFEEHLGTAPTDDVEELTLTARRALRARFLTAEVGITGANFGIAETGTISITENEGNARLTMGLPPVHVVVMGLEKVLPRLEDLALFLPVLATAGTGQLLTCYNSLVSGPRQPGEPDGPEEMHVVLLDNGRTALLADGAARDALRCIRCGACLNACPVYRSIGGHAYGTTYQGPIGAVITPYLRSLPEWRHLSSASSLCGACTETCPVGIDLHTHLLRNRRHAIDADPSWAGRVAASAFAVLARHPRLFRLAVTLLRAGLRATAGRRLAWLPGVGAWTTARELPRTGPQSFRAYWRQREVRR